MDDSRQHDAADRPAASNENRLSATTRVAEQPHRNTEGDRVDDGQNRLLDERGGQQW